MRFDRLAVAFSFSFSFSFASLAACQSSSPEKPAPTATTAALTATATAKPTAAASATGAEATMHLTLKEIDLPKSGDDHVGMDVIAFDPSGARVWVPAGNTGSVDVIDVEASDKVERVEGFATKEVEREGKKHVVGPSAAVVGDGVVYVSDRADSNLCAIDAKTLKKEGCVKLDSSPDLLGYVKSAKELWVTTPRDKRIVILDVSTPAAPKAKDKITLEGEPEGITVDDAHGQLYTNYEDKDRTVAIDIKTHKVVSTWMPKCGDDGPKGLRIDSARRVLVVACPDHVVALDAGHDGALLSSLAVGEGVDDIDYAEPRHLVYVGAGKAGKLTIAALDDKGKLAVVGTIATSPGARNAIAGANGDAYLTDSRRGKILVVSGVR